MGEGRDRTGEPRAGELMATLALYLVPAGGCTVVVWHVLNELLTGHPVGAGWLGAAALAGVVLSLLLRRLGRYLKDAAPGTA